MTAAAYSDACPDCGGACPRNACTSPRVRARRVLVRHLSEAPLLARPFPERLAGILDDLAVAGVLPVDAPRAAPAPVLQLPAPRPSSAETAPLPEPAAAALAVVAARRRLGWSQADVADRAEVSIPTVRRVERGQSVTPTSLRAVLAALDLPET